MTSQSSSRRGLPLLRPSWLLSARSLSKAPQALAAGVETLSVRRQARLGERRRRKASSIPGSGCAKREVPISPAIASPRTTPASNKNKFNKGPAAQDCIYLKFLSLPSRKVMPRTRYSIRLRTSRNRRRRRAHDQLPKLAHPLLRPDLCHLVRTRSFRGAACVPETPPRVLPRPVGR
ncbi:hypothetical protein BDZ88DRAFT_403629 [Geranomyces variabilis]|nr:hypothetical protein BDZ88DRAFT_403629 [Geranomyces variabilis]